MNDDDDDNVQEKTEGEDCESQVEGRKSDDDEEEIIIDS